MYSICAVPISAPDSEEPMCKLELEGSNTKITAAQWGLFDERLVTAHEDGEVRLYDIRSLKTPVKRTTPHKDAINDLQFNKDRTMFITASRDHTAKVCLGGKGSAATWWLGQAQELFTFIFFFCHHLSPSLPPPSHD